MATVTFRSLTDVVENIDDVDQRLIMYAVRPWTAQSPIWTAHLGQKEPPRPPHGFEYMLEVYLAKEAIEVWTSWHDEQVPTTTEACEAVIYYAEYDAYQPDDSMRQDPNHSRNDAGKGDQGIRIVAGRRHIDRRCWAPLVVAPTIVVPRPGWS